MSTTVQNNGAVNSTFSLTMEALGAVKGQGTPTDFTVPGAKETIKSLQAQPNDQLPVLESPDPKVGQEAMKNLKGLTLGGLSLETLMDAINSEERKTETKAGTANLKANADARKAANDEKIKKLQEELEKAKKAETLNTLMKVFKWIGVAAAAIGGVALIVASGGAVAPIVCGAIALLMVADSIVEEATDGKYGCSVGEAVRWIAKACGASDETARWIKLGVDLALSVATMFIGASGALKAADGGIKVLKALKEMENVQKVASFATKASAVVGLGAGIVQSGTAIGNAVNERDIATLQADQKRMNAILERIAQANDLTVEHLKRVIERIEKLTEQVSDIVKDNAETDIAIMTGQQPPAMA